MRPQLPGTVGEAELLPEGLARHHAKDVCSHRQRCPPPAPAPPFSPGLGPSLPLRGLSQELRAHQASSAAYKRRREVLTPGPHGSHAPADHPHIEGHLETSARSLVEGQEDDPQSWSDSGDAGAGAAFNMGGGEKTVTPAVRPNQQHGQWIVRRWLLVLEQTQEGSLQADGRPSQGPEEPEKYPGETRLQGL